MTPHLPQQPIPVEEAVTLDGLFQRRLERSPEAPAYRFFDDTQAGWRSLTWSQMAEEIGRWQAAMQQENLQPGDRVAIMLKNCPHWVCFDQAAIGLGLVTVPLYTSDRPENVAYILKDAGVKLLLIDSVDHWRPVHDACHEADTLLRIVATRGEPSAAHDPRMLGLSSWLPPAGKGFVHLAHDPDALATIVYTSGTTGKSKGVMLSHRNLLSNAYAALLSFAVYADDVLLSFLPLSHCLERQAGYYLPMMAGAEVAFARSFQLLHEDLMQVRPTVLISVPRIFERILAALHHQLEKGPRLRAWLVEQTVSMGFHHFEHAQQRASWHPKLLLYPLLHRWVAAKVLQRLGGRLRLAIAGAAPLPPDVARTFLGFGLPILQGYGLTETSPVVSVNVIEDNLPSSVGQALAGVEVKLGEQDALLVRGSNVMLGYWNNPEATHAMIDAQGWLNTGDIARIDADGHVTITGRIKEIIVLNNGEKIPPADMEQAIMRDPILEQGMVVGEGEAYLSLIAVVQRDEWIQAAQAHGLSTDWPLCLQDPKAKAFALTRIAEQIKAFPGYARIRRVALLSEPWTVENGLLTPTLKLRRSQVMARFSGECETLYQDFHA
jgi:long-chain acyl-CoA synthetase